MELFDSPFCVLAHDPGKSGALVRIGRHHFDVRRDFKDKTDIARGIRDLSADVTHVVMELVHAMPGQGVCSMFNFGRASGVADGAFALALPHLAVEEVAPQKWQNFYRRLHTIPKDVEFDSRPLASKIFPVCVPYLKRKKDHNTADAVLLALWKHAQLICDVTASTSGLPVAASAAEAPEQE